MFFIIYHRISRFSGGILLLIVMISCTKEPIKLKENIDRPNPLPDEVPISTNPFDGDQYTPPYLTENWSGIGSPSGRAHRGNSDKTPALICGNGKIEAYSRGKCKKFLYAIGNDNGNDASFLYFIKDIFGHATPIGDTGFDNIRGLDFDVNGRLLALGTLRGQPIEHVLIELDCRTGAGTLLGPLSLENIGDPPDYSTNFALSIRPQDGLAYSGTGILGSLVRISLLTGMANLSGVTGLSSPLDRFALFFIPSQELLLAHEQTLYNVSISSGNATSLGALPLTSDEIIVDGDYNYRNSRLTILLENQLSEVYSLALLDSVTRETTSQNPISGIGLNQKVSAIAHSAILEQCDDKNKDENDGCLKNCLLDRDRDNFADYIDPCVLTGTE